jgi:dethiobiotin synthetase
MRPPKARGSGKVIFVTGTDTGVGKTLLTGLLLLYLRHGGAHALAMKPVCSGSRADARLLAALQDNELDVDEVNPFHFKAPLAPLVASGKERRPVDLAEVLRTIQQTQRRCEWLLVEGVGGVLVPMGERWFVRDLVCRLRSKVVVVSRNRLGTINQTMLTAEALRRVGIRHIRIVLMNEPRPDSSSSSNRLILSELLRPIPVFGVKFLGSDAASPSGLAKHLKKARKTLAQVLG